MLPCETNESLTVEMAVRAMDETCLSHAQSREPSAQTEQPFLVCGQSWAPTAHHRPLERQYSAWKLPSLAHPRPSPESPKAYLVWQLHWMEEVVPSPSDSSLAASE